MVILNSHSYISSSLAHFVGRSLKNDDDKYSLLMRIILSGIISFPPHDIKKEPRIEIKIENPISENTMLNPDVVCFCDIPDSCLYLHTKKYSRFGLSFTKEFLEKQGARPVFYIPISSKPSLMSSKYSTMKDLMDSILSTYSQTYSKVSLILNQLKHAKDKQLDISISNAMIIRNLMDISKITNGELLDAFVSVDDLEQIREDKLDLFLLFTNIISLFTIEFLSFCKFFDSSKTEDDIDNYYFEREWRVLGNVRFSIDDIHTVYLPQTFCDVLKNELPELSGKVVETS